MEEKTPRADAYIEVSLTDRWGSSYHLTLTQDEAAKLGEELHDIFAPIEEEDTFGM